VREKVGVGFVICGDIFCGNEGSFLQAVLRFLHVFGGKKRGDFVVNAGYSVVLMVMVGCG
jgi:hypothetical protein